MARRLRILAILLVQALSLASAQDTTSSSDPTSTSDTTPSHTDNAGQQNNGQENADGLYSYYLIFIALILCVAGVATYLSYKRRKNRGVFMQQSRESALQRDLNAWDPTRARRRYWQGRWRSADISHEEGLDAHGEAPPPYVPKSADEESGPHSAGCEPAVPMHTLSRDQAGLKPPDYTETSIDPEHDGRASSASIADSPDRPAASQSGTQYR